MKKLPLFFLLSLMTLSTLSQAQFGVKGGANFSVVGSYGNTEDGETGSLKPGYQFGIFYNADLVLGFDILVELNYEARGTISKKDYSFKLPVQDSNSGTILGIGDYDVSQEIRSVQNYINLPILLTFGPENLKIYAGPNIGYLVSGNAAFERTIEVTLGGTVIQETDSEINDINWKDFDKFEGIFAQPTEESGDFLNSFELGMNVGAMFYLNDNFFADLRINQGFTDVSNNDYDNSIYPSEDFTFASRSDTDRNLSIQLSLGYSF